MKTMMTHNVIALAFLFFYQASAKLTYGLKRGPIRDEIEADPKLLEAWAFAAQKKRDGFNRP